MKLENEENKKNEFIFENKFALVNFSYKQEIGQHGKNSQVFLAHDNNLDAQIVIKQIKKNRINNVKSYFQEARKLYKNCHPNIVQVLYACEDKMEYKDAFIYIAMPFYKNKSLKDLIENKFLTVREIIKYSTEFLSGLNHIHINKFIHFDIKPDNIMLSDRMECLLSDFGLTEYTNDLGFAKPEFIYTKICPPEYIAALADKHAKFEFDRLFDIYQVGLTLYCMCCGNKNLNDQIHNINNVADLYQAIKKGTYPNLSLIPEHIPDKMKKAIKKCIAFNPNERFQSALDIINYLADIDGNLVDWEYSINEKTKTKEWKKKDNKGNIRKLCVDITGKSTATKIIQNGTERQEKKYCLEHIQSKQIISFLSEVS